MRKRKTIKVKVLSRINKAATSLALLTCICLSINSCKSDEADKVALVDGPDSPKLQQKLAQLPASNENPFSRAEVSSQQIKVVYPSSSVPASSTFIAGAIAAGHSLTCNGDAVHVSPEGFFAHVVQLKPGDNNFLLEEPQTAIRRELKVKRENPPPPISPNEFRLDENSLQPNNERGVAAGDLIEFRAKATPDSDVSVSLGKRKIFLRSASAAAHIVRRKSQRKNNSRKTTSKVNQGLDAAYGNVYQRHSASPPDLYIGFYKVQLDDKWVDAQPKFSLSHAGKSKSIVGSAKFTTLPQPLIAETLHNETITRVGPGAGRSTPLESGVRLLIDGWQGEEMRCLFAPSHHFWIKKTDLNFEQDGRESGPPPNSVARTINVGRDDYGATVSIPLSQRLPYQVEQHSKPNELVLRIFGVTADTDWVTPALSGGGLIDQVSCRQAADGIYEVKVPVKSSRQWGFKADYNDATLVLHIKSPPKLTGDTNSLQGLKICVDPGHGGRESGAIGCSGIKEATINLAIAMKLKALLESAGAQVTMTRVTDQDVSLDERVAIANNAHSDVLISVHNNSLPDGRDPLHEHGTSSYWYHPQSTALARYLNEGMVDRIGFPDFGSRFQNLALTRPSGMLAVLAEVGFVVNPEEYASLISPEGQQKSANGILNGLLNYLHPKSKK